MICDFRFAICNWKRRETLSAMTMVVAIGLGLAGGCIMSPQNPAATQPATAIDPATTQPYYWLAKPAAAQVQGRDFDTVWDVCKSTARDYLFALDRVDYRSGVVSTVPLVSKQWFEPWRPDTGSISEAFANSLGAIRRTLRFEVSRNDDGTYTIAPKVLIEREVILERNVTDVSQYRFAFAGPATKIPAREAVTLEPDTYPDVPIKYWYPTGRDAGMEVDVAKRVRKTLAKREGAAGGAGSAIAGGGNPLGGAPLLADGEISEVASNEVFYINVGAADKVVAGMTFEVYEARAALPTLAAFGKENPQSKGWIEVVSVGNGRSACKAIKSVERVPLKKGDQVFNFVFRRGRQNHFTVAGDFAGSDRETIVGLIWRWNGVVDNRVGTQTDYLILGNAPNQQAAREVYDSIKSQAEQLKVPVLSEERFNLMIRYYDPVKR